MSAPPSVRFRPHGPAWVVLVLAAVAGLAGWWWMGRPVALPDAPTSRIACVSYAPYRRPGETPYRPGTFISPERIDADLRALSRRFDCVRTYAQGQGLDAVPAIARRHGMQVLMGVWLARDPEANAREVAMAIATAKADADVLRGVVVGNEVLLRGELSPAALAGYVRQVRAAVPATVPVTYADVWEFWLRYPQMARAVDLLTIHILPYWEDAPVPPAYAVRHVAQVYARMRQAFPGKPVMIGETGWPSAGRPRRAARATRVNEARYLRSFLRYAAGEHMAYNVIEAFDQPWKRVQEGTVGGYWGIFDADARPKFAMTGPVVEEPRWWWGWVAGGLGAVLFGLGGRGRTRCGIGALGLAGFATGAALAWQVRQMSYACRTLPEWGASAAACVAALATAAWLASRLARHLGGRETGPPAPPLLRLGWLFGLAWYDLLLVFDGRYRDFPLGLFAPPCVAYALVAWLDARAPYPPLEHRMLALLLPLLGVLVVWQEAGLNLTAWLWLGLNLALALAVLWAWRQASGLRTRQA